jgi:hypothetical protein
VNHCFVAFYFQKEKPRTLESKGPKTSHPLQIESENRCNKRVIHTVLEPTRRIIQAFSQHNGMNHCFVALYFQIEKPRTLESKGPKTSHPLQIESENRCNKRVIHTVLEPTRRIIQAFSQHNGMNHCFVALYFQIEKPRTLESKGPKTSHPLQIESENRCNKRVIHTVLEP